MLKKIFISFTFFMCFQYGSSQPLGFSLMDGKRSVQISFELNSNLIIVPVVLNGMLPLRFILDTGVRTTILTEKAFSDILNLSYSRKYSIAGIGKEKNVSAYVTNNVSIDLPGVNGNGHAMLVLDEDYLQLSNYLGTDVHGILGYELFSRFIIKIDYERKILTIMYPEEFKPRKKYQKIPIRMEDTKPYITAEVTQNGGEYITAKLLIDTGASHALMLESTSDERIVMPTNYISSVIGRGLGGLIMGKVGRVKSIKIGKFIAYNPIASFPDPNSYVDSLKLGSVIRNGSLGGEMLSRFTVIFDFPNERIYLNKNSVYRKPFHYNLSGLTVRATGKDLNEFEIIEVRPTSAADKAGIVAGDMILSANGISSTQIKLNHLIGYFNSKPAKQVVLIVQRNGLKLKKKIILSDPI